MPSRKVISIFIIVVALVAAVVISSGISPISSNSELRISVENNSKGEVLKNTNWQQDIEALNIKKTAEATSTESFTDVFGRSLVANYLSLKENNSLNDASAQTLINKAGEFIDTPNATETYTLKDIVVSSDTSKESVTRYGNGLGLVFKQNKPQGKAKNEIILFGEMLQNKDSSKSIELKNIAKVYGNIASSLLLITVPSSFTADHLALAQGFSDISNAVSNLADGLSDPLKAAGALATYRETYQNLLVVRSRISFNLIKAGTNYKQTDNGYYFFFNI